MLETAVDLENADRITRTGAGRRDDRLPVPRRRVRVRPGVVQGDNLEIGVGYSPLGSPSRDLIDVSRLIDQWSVLGLPLQVTLAFPPAPNRTPT